MTTTFALSWYDDQATCGLLLSLHQKGDCGDTSPSEIVVREYLLKKMPVIISGNTSTIAIAPFENLIGVLGSASQRKLTSTVNHDQAARQLDVLTPLISKLDDTDQGN